MKTSILLIAFALIQLGAKAQNSSVELFSGNKATNILLRMNEPLKEKSRWGVLGVLNSNMPYTKENPIYNYHFIQTALSYRIVMKPKIKVGIMFGSFKNPKFYGPLAGLQVFYPFKNGVISITNQHQFADTYTSNLVGVFEYRPKINEKLSLYTRLQVMSETDFEITTRSYQMLRIGLGYKKIQFGLSATFDQFKNQTILMENYGLFIRTTL